MRSKAEALIEVLRTYREAEGITRRQIGKKMGTSFWGVTCIEERYKYPGFDKLLAYAEALGYEIVLKKKGPEMNPGPHFDHQTCVELATALLTALKAKPSDHSPCEPTPQDPAIPIS